MLSFEDEEVLIGGNVFNVYCLGDIVWWELKLDSYKFYKLLKYLENKGFSYVLKFLGIDEKGREVLLFIEGEVGNYFLKKYMWFDDVLIEIGKMFCFYYDLVSDFLFDDSWKLIDNIFKLFEILCYNDFVIYNIIFKYERLVGIIDFDVVGFGLRIWDIVYIFYMCVFLSRFYFFEIGEKIYYNLL